MGIGSELQVLGQFLDECERRGDAVESVDVAGVTDTEGGQLAADLDLTLSLDVGDTGSLTLRDPRVGPDGTIRFGLESTRDFLPATDHDVGVEPTDVSLDGDTVTVSLAATVPSDARSATADTTAASEASTPDTDPGTLEVEQPDAVDSGDGTDGTGRVEDDRWPGPTNSGRDRDVPPFKDPDLLASVYESCETFAEMADELEMDVTAETVRRYMIDFDIHEPNRYQTSGADATATATGTREDERPVVLSDGIGLPDDVTVDTLVETVKRSNTIYEVKQEIDVERDDALEMLQELNLLDIVVGRLATEGERDITREDVVDRLRDASAVQ